MIKWIVIICLIRSVFSQICGNFCDLCNASTQLCEKCVEGLEINNLTHKCQSTCKYGQYYHLESKSCLSICPQQYYNDDESYICRQLQKCPFLSEQGMQFFDEFTHSIVHERFIVTSGKNYLKDDYTLKIFNSTNGKYLGYMEGHDSEILLLTVVDSTQQLLSISANQMIWWNLYYGLQESIVYFGRVDTNSQQSSSPQSNQIQYNQKSTYLYYLEKVSQSIYQDEDIIILWQNPKQFGILYHKKLRTCSGSTNNLQLFHQYFQLFDVMHTSAIKGFFKIDKNIIGSFSNKVFVTWDIQKNKTISGMQGVCNFQKEEIYRVLRVSNTSFLIQFLNIPQFSIYDVPLNSCFKAEYDIFPPDDGSKKFMVEDIFIYDTNEEIFMIRTKKAIFIYQIVITVESNNQNKPKYSLSQIGSEKFDNIFLKVIPNKYLFLLQPSGLLKYYILSHYNSESEDEKINLSLFGEIDFQFKQQMYITEIHYQEDILTTILVGKELTSAKFINAENNLFEEHEIVSSLKNISPQVNGHRGQINGIVIDKVFQNRIITYSSDGSFKIWEMYDDETQSTGFATTKSQGGYLGRARLLMDQYHPQCNIIESSRCAWGVLSLEQIETDIILTLFSDNNIILWKYFEDEITLYFTYSLSDETFKINNYQYNRDLKYLIICNDYQTAIFDTVNDGEVIFNQSGTYYRGFFFKGDKSFDNSYSLVLLNNLNQSKFQFVVYFYDIATRVFTQQKQNQFKNAFQYAEIYQDNIIICVTVTNLYYQLKKTPDHLNVAMKFPISYFTHDVLTSKTFILYKNGMVGIGQDTKFVYKNITSVDATLRCTAIANNPLIFFYFQNNVYYPGYNQIIGLNEQLDIVYYMVFEDTISSINVDSINSKIFIGFQNGKVYHGPFIKQQQNIKDSTPNLITPYYSIALRQLFFSKKTSILKKDLLLNTTVEFNSSSAKTVVHKQNIEGYIVDESTNTLITYSKEPNTCLYKWPLKNPQQSIKISDQTTLGITKAFLDVKGDYLIGYSENWVSVNNYNFDIIVWKYSTLKQIALNQSHKKYFEEQKRDELPENVSQMVYSVKQVFHIPNNSTLITLNNNYTIFIYQYNIDQTDIVAVNNVFKLYYDDVYNYIYARIVDNFSQYIDIFDFSFKHIATKANHTYEIRDILFVDDRVITYDIQTIIVLSRKNFTQLVKIITQNPKVTSLIISAKLNIAVVWNNFLTEEVFFYKIAIFDLNTGKTIQELQPLSNTEYGNTNLVYLEESTCQLYYTRTTGYIYSFNVCEQYNSGIYSANMLNITEMFYIPEFNYLATINQYQTSLTRVEQSISSRQKYSLLYSQKNQNYFINQKNNQTYYTDFDNSVWKLNNKEFSFEYITQLDKILFSKSYKNKFYVATLIDLQQYDENFKFLNSINVKIKNLYFSNEYIFYQDEAYFLRKLEIQRFSLDLNFQIPLQDYVKHVFIFENFNEILIYENSTLLLRINFITNQYLYHESIQSPFQQSIYSQSLNMIIHVQKNSDLIFYYGLIANMNSQSAAQIYSFKNTDLQQFTPQKILIDEENLSITIAYSDYTIRVFKILFVDNLITQINQLLVLPQPSITNILKLRFKGKNLQLFLPWQVIEYDRKDLVLINNFNNSQLIQNMYQYEYSQDVSRYMFISQQNSLQMVDAKQQKVLFKFDLSYPQIISQSIQASSFQYNIEIKGLSNGIFFKYNFLIPKEDYLTSIDVSFRECYFDVGYIERFYNQYNQLNILTNSLNQLSFRIDRTLIQISPALSIYYQPSMDQYNSKILLQGKSENNGKNNLNFQFDTFKPEKFKEIQLQNYQVDIKDCEFMTFNQRTKRVTFEDLVVFGVGNNTVFDFYNMDYVILENILVDSVTLQNNSTLFQFSNSKFVLLKNISFININLNQQSKLFLFKNIQSFLIFNLTINNVKINSFSKMSTLIQIYNVKKGIIKYSNFNNFINSQQLDLQFSNYVFDFQGNSYLQIQNCSFSNSNNIGLIHTKNSYEENERIYYRVHDQLYLSEIKVINIKNLTNSLVKATGYLINIYDSQFSQINCQVCVGGIGNFQEVLILEINNSSFASSSARNGGALALIQNRFNQSLIKNSNFTNNSAESSGGAIYIQFSDLFLEGNVIESNTALIGGGIRYFGIQPSFIEDILRDEKNKELNSFKNNKAAIHSQNYGSYVYQTIMESNIGLTENLLQSFQPLSKDDKIDKDKLIIKQYVIKEFQSGGTIDLKFSILDIENNPINFNIDKVLSRKYPAEIIEEIEQFQVKATISNNDIKIYGQYITNYQQFDPMLLQFTIKEMQIVSMPQMQNFIHLEIPAVKRVLQTNSYFYDGPFYIKLIINFRQCVQGEIYTPSSSLFLCGECKIGTYSLAEPIKEEANIQSCLRCPAEAEQCFRNQIQLKQGYWRISNQTDNILKCSNNPLNCQGEEQYGYCKEGHYGPLCEQCDVNGILWGKKFVTDGKYNCVECSELQSNFKYFLPSIIVAICMVIYMVISIRIALEISELIVIGFYLRKMNLISISRSAFLDTTNMNMKAMMNYMQIAQLVNTFEVDLPDFLKILPEYIGQPVNNFMYTLDCFLNDVSTEQFPVVYLRTIWSLTMPFLYIIGMGLIYFFLITCKLSKHSKSYIINGLVFLIFFLQPSMISHLLRVMSCRQIDKSSYVLADITQTCYTKMHVLYIFYICIPGLILWGFFIPVFILRKLLSNKNNLDNALIRVPYGFLYQDYKYNMFYWEFIKSYLKILIVVIHNFYGDPYNNKLVLTIIMMLIYQVALLRFQPYQMRYFQDIEKRSMEVLIVIVTMNIFLYNRPDIVQQQIFYVIVLGIHNIYQLYLIWEVIKAKIKIIYTQNKENIKAKLKRFFPYVTKWIDMSNKKSMKVFYYWKRVQNEIRYAKEKKIRMMKRQTAKIYFDEEIEKEREKVKVKNIPVTSSQLSMRAEQSSMKTLIREVSGLLSPQNDNFNSFLIKSPTSRMDSLLTPRDDFKKMQSIFIDVGNQNSFRFNGDEANNDRQFDRLFEALKKQKKWKNQGQSHIEVEDSKDKQDVIKIRTKKKNETLIYKNLSRVPTLATKSSDLTMPSENLIRIPISQNDQLDIQDESAIINIEEQSQSIASPYKQTNYLLPKQQIFNNDSAQSEGRNSQNSDKISLQETPTKIESAEKKQQVKSEDNCNVINSEESERFLSLDKAFGQFGQSQDSESLRPKQLFDKLKKQVTSEYINDYQFSNYNFHHNYQSTKSLGNSSKFEITTLKNNQQSNQIVQYKNTDPDSQQDFQSSKVEEYSSDNNRVIVNFDPQSQKQIYDNSIVASTFGQLSQLNFDQLSSKKIQTLRQEKSSDIKDFQTIQSKQNNSPYNKYSNNLFQNDDHFIMKQFIFNNKDQNSGEESPFRNQFQQVYKYFNKNKTQFQNDTSEIKFDREDSENNNNNEDIQQNRNKQIDKKNNETIQSEKIEHIEYLDQQQQQRQNNNLNQIPQQQIDR